MRWVQFVARDTLAAQILEHVRKQQHISLLLQIAVLAQCLHAKNIPYFRCVREIGLRRNAIVQPIVERCRSTCRTTSRNRMGSEFLQTRGQELERIHDSKFQHPLPIIAVAVDSRDVFRERNARRIKTNCGIRPVSCTSVDISGYKSRGPRSCTRSSSDSDRTLSYRSRRRIVRTRNTRPPRESFAIVDSSMVSQVSLRATTNALCLQIHAVLARTTARIRSRDDTVGSRTGTRPTSNARNSPPCTLFRLYV